MPLFDDLLAIGRDHGIERLGVAPAAPMTRARDALVDRTARGFTDGMQFTFKNPERSTDPGRDVAGARSVLVGARPYLLDEPAPPSGPAARVARYGWVDHYQPLREGLWAIARHLRSLGYRAVAHADDNSVVDREAAWLAGIGWFGKNANLLVPGAGSWFVLGSVVTTAELPVSTPVPDGCGSCTRCIEGCPTGAIVGPGVVDARRCLAWQLQRPGIVPSYLRVAVGDRIYGCDDCQEVCPPSTRERPVHLRRAPSVDGEVQAHVPVLELLAADDERILERYGRWYLAGRDPRWLRRNALLVLGNVADPADPAVLGALARYLAVADPILRAHAVWAAARLGHHHLVPASDPDPLVRAELEALAEVPVRTGGSGYP